MNRQSDRTADLKQAVVSLREEFARCGQTGDELRSRVEDLETLAEGIKTELADARAQLKRESEGRKRFEKSLRESEARFRSVLENSLDAAYRRDLNIDRYDYVSPVIEQITGFTAGEFSLLSMENIIEHIHPDDREAMIAKVEAVMHGTCASERIEYRFRRKDGEYRWIADYFREIADESGTPRYLVGAAREITGRRQVEEELRESEERFRTLAENSHAVVGFLQDSRFVYVNPYFEKISGYGPEEIYSSDFSCFIHPDDREIMADRARRRLAGEPVETHYEFRILTKSGETRWIDFSPSLVMLKGKPAIAGIGIDFTERKMAEESLHVRSSELETVLDAVPAAVWIAHDPLGLQITGNRLSYEWLGLPVGANMSKSAPENERPDTFRLFRNGVELGAEEMPVQVSASGIEIRNFEFDIVYPYGGVRHMLGNATPLRDEFGNPRGSVSAFMDITDRKHAEEKVRESEEIMRYIVKHDPNAIAVYDKGMRYVAVSDRFLHDYGVKEEDVIGRRHYDVFPELPEKWKDVHQRCLSGAVERNDDDQFERPDGSITYNRWECRPWRRADGSIAGMILYSEVTTERKKAELELRASEIRFRAAVDNFPGVFIVYDSGRHIQFMNRQGIEKAGRPLEEIIGRFDEEVFPPETTSKYLPSLLRAIETKTRQMLETNLATPKKEYWVIMNLIPLLTDEGDVWQLLLISQDITERKQAEERANSLNERLRRQAEQLAVANREMEAFSYSVSHDLRAPLRSIDGFSAALLEDFSDKLGEEGGDYLERIRAAAQRMGHLIDDLLNLSRASRAEMRQRTVDLSVIAKDILNDLRKMDPSREVETAVQEGITAEGDPDLLRQTLDNLLRNAWKFTSKTVHARIEFGAARENGHTVYFVRDNGAGFDMRYSDRLFIPFRRLHSEDEFPGTGIGLSIISRIVHRHGGEIWAEGAVGEGAAFFFTLHAPRPAPKSELAAERG